MQVDVGENLEELLHLRERLRNVEAGSGTAAEGEAHHAPWSETQRVGNGRDQFVVRADLEDVGHRRSPAPVLEGWFTKRSNRQRGRSDSDALPTCSRGRQGLASAGLHRDGPAAAWLSATAAAAPIRVEHRVGTQSPLFANANCSSVPSVWAAREVPKAGSIGVRALYEAVDRLAVEHRRPLGSQSARNASVGRSAARAAGPRLRGRAPARRGDRRVVAGQFIEHSRGSTYVAACVMHARARRHRGVGMFGPCSQGICNPGGHTDPASQFAPRRCCRLGYVTEVGDPRGAWRPRTAGRCRCDDHST